MAVRPITVIEKKCSTGFTGPTFAYEVNWDAILNNDVGEPSSSNLIPWLDRTFQVEGTFGGATLAIQGSNDGGAHWHTLSNPQGTPVSFTTPGILQVLEVVEMMRPEVTGGDGTTDLDVFGFFRRTYAA